MDIIMIPFHDCKKWIKEGYRTRDAHLAEHFCNNPKVDKVIVINRPVSIFEMVLKKTSWKTSSLIEPPFSILKKKNYEICQLNEKLYCLDIFLPDFFRVIIERKKWWFSAFQNKTTIKIIKNLKDELNLKEVVLLLQNPMAIGAIDSLKYNCFAFDAIDNWLYHPQMKSSRKIVKKNYDIVSQKADVIFTVSQALKDTFNKNANVHWLANGVDINFFSNAVSTNTKSNVIGYVGKIQDRVDFSLIEQCLVRYPQKTFLFIGPIYAQKNIINKLKKQYQNIKFVGDVHYLKLAEILKTVDIAIIPHYVDNFTNSMNPLKLYEYLASGKPVITTGVAGTENLSQYIYTGNGTDFVNLIDYVSNQLENNVIHAEDIISSVPLECTWDARSALMIDKIEEVLKNEQQN